MISSFTEKFYGENVEKPSKCQSIHESFRGWLVHLSSIKFLTGYYLMSISYYNVISGYKYTEYYNITFYIAFFKVLHQENMILGFRSNISKLIILNPFVPHMFCKVYKGNPVKPIY